MVVLGVGAANTVSFCTSAQDLRQQHTRMANLISEEALARAIFTEKPSVRRDDVAGFDAAKEALQQVHTSSLFVFVC